MVQQPGFAGHPFNKLVLTGLFVEILRTKLSILYYARHKCTNEPHITPIAFCDSVLAQIPG